MTVESAVYINTLNASYPEGSSDAKQGDDHIRLVKSVLQASFPYITGPMLVTQTELNYLSGLSSNLVSQLALKAPLASPALSGTPTAPTPGVAVNNTQIATTAYVQGQKVSPQFTGTPTAPTPTTGANNTQIATTEFVQIAVVAATGGVTRGRSYFYGSFS